MNTVPSRAIENGLTAQLMNRVMPIPRQCSRTPARAAKSIFSSIGTIISQIRAATTRFTWANSAPAMSANVPGTRWPRPMPATMQSPTQTLR